MLQSVKKLVGAGKTAPSQLKKTRPQLDLATISKPVNESQAKLDQAKREHDACSSALTAAETELERLQQNFDADPSASNEAALLGMRREIERQRLHVDRAARLWRQAEQEYDSVVAARDEGIRVFYQGRVDSLPDEVRELWETKLKATFEEVAALLDELDQLYNEAHAAILELTRGNPDAQFARVSGLNSDKTTRIRALAREDIGYKTLERIEQICR